MKRIVKIAACLACASALFFSCKEEPGDSGLNVLEVSPSENIQFEATGNEAVTLTVTTDADTWDFTAPEWIDATKTDNTLMVNAQDNTTSASRVGRLEFTAGNAESVKITVLQAAGSGASGDGSVSIVDASTETADAEISVSFSSMSEIPSGTAQVKVVLADAVAEDVTVTLALDPEYLEEYILLHDDMDCELFPESAVKFSSETLTVRAGELESDPVTVTMDASVDGVKSNVKYLVPILAENVSGAEISSADSRVNYIVTRRLEKEVKNVIYFEVNDCNPLNALEYLLEDGTPFFDAVILFAGNINYNSTDDLVYLSNNPNVTALLDGTDTYLQPLREKGIKVYLGLLGNHDAAGLCQLSDWGAEQFAAEVADAVLEYRIDGVNLDDEYSSSPIIGNKWFTSRSSAAGCRLCYELSNAMDAVCDWETEVSVFQYGSLYSLTSVDGVDCSEFVDFWVANYGGSTRPQGNMTLKQCSFTSVECNRGYIYGVDESSARSAKEEGYGWCMWFAFDPSGTGTVSSNYSTTFPAMQSVARGLYDMELLEPTGVYNKIGEGQYDPTRYDFIH
ncbi:MAG: DUF1735 domain-containing protein [Bacteroidetes bacterium]|uniref:DUF1735 domain-containing protein n=1 Tax=Candidatus Cryptobacteroides merdavium TaxID=2840769 RepID=A0A9D9ECD6_9BACT|nr:DUF1735 domain-containing protein [Candidatus Cryptobacteroides merdavium]